MKSTSLLASLFCAAANAAVLERREQCLTGSLASFAPLSTDAAAATYCSQSFPVAAVTVTATATDVTSVTATVTQTVVTTVSTTETDTATETATETVTDTTTTTTTTFPTVTVEKRSKHGRCKNTKGYPTTTESASSYPTTTESASSYPTHSACPYDDLLCDLTSKTPEVQSEVCSCLQQAATATVTTSVTTTASVTEEATVSITTITSFTTTGTVTATTTTTAIATSVVDVPGVCTSAGASCSAGDHCCAGTSCRSATFTAGTICCNASGGYCNLFNPAGCCSGTCFNAGDSQDNSKGYCG